MRVGVDMCIIAASYPTLHDSLIFIFIFFSKTIHAPPPPTSL